ncbi:MAG: cobaltochelatase subunit CobN [Desulfobacterales bacterium]|nr:cobaltochelatase subunit CobN [Desulfobacterales bacterium]
MVGGPAYNDSAAAVEALAALDVPYIAAHPLEFQTLGQWAASAAGLGPVETTMLIALPEIDGATNPTVFAGRHGENGCTGCAPALRAARSTAKRDGALPRADRGAGRQGRAAGAAAPQPMWPTRKVAHRPLRLSAERGCRGDRRLSVGVRKPVQHAARDEGRGL